MTELSFVPGIEVRLATKQDLEKIRELAVIIFPFTYRDIVPAEQIDYMMDMFYSPENLVRQFEDAQQFLIIYYEGKAAGFASYSKLTNQGIFKLNKIYLDPGSQGKGLGKWLLNEVIYRVKAAGGKNLQLNVNKNNKAVGFYQSMGFSKLKDEVIDIGNNYVMDDFIMHIPV